MIYRGRVKDGVVVLETPNALPDGVEVRVEVVPAETEGSLLDEKGQTLGEKQDLVLERIEVECSEIQLGGAELL